MKQLLDGRLAPLTFKIGFLNRSLRGVSDFYLDWTRQHHKHVESRPVEEGLEGGLALLEPLVTPPRRVFWLSTQSEWTAYFDNGTRGGDPFPPISFMAEQLSCRGLIATVCPHNLETEVGTTKGVYGAVQFEMLGPRPTDFLNCERSLSVAYEAGRWRFDASGTVQPFERVEHYKNRIIRNRFTVELLDEYCQALGVRLFDESYYAGPGVLVVIRDPLPAGSIEVSLAEAQEAMALR